MKTWLLPVKTSIIDSREQSQQSSASEVPPAIMWTEV